MELKVGDKITWQSAAGSLTGTIFNVSISKSAANLMTAWIDISLGSYSIRLCGTDSYIKMMKITKL